MFYCYILRCKDGTLYCGCTNDLKKRAAAHNAGRGSKYVRSRGGGVIIYHERFKKLGDVLHREAEIKKWPRAKKLRLIKTAK